DEYDDILGSCHECTHPALEMIARKECQAAAATSNGGVIGSKYLGEWKYTTAFLQETFGISPTISTRECASVDHLPISNDKPTFIPK
ncbi:unnamed protein product, partial [Aphanomyces euteiches]